jgi:hypothetical protein
MSKEHSIESSTHREKSRGKESFAMPAKSPRNNLQPYKAQSLLALR